MSSWRSLLLRIGDKCADYGSSVEYKDHIDICFGLLRREIEHDANDILPYLLQCAEQLPHKIPLYGTLVGLINLENEDFVKDFLENSHSNLQDAVTVGNSDKIRVMLRFLTALMCSKVLQPMSLVVLFDTLLSFAATTLDEEKGNPLWQARGDFYVKCILSCLPWGGSELIEQAHEEIERIMVGIEAYMGIRKHNSDYGVSFLDDDESKNFLGEKDFLEDLWKRIKDLSANDWKFESVPRPHLAFEAQLISGKVHEFHPINIPEHLDSTFATICGMENFITESKFPQRLHRLNIFPACKFEDMQPVDRFVIEEYILDVLLFLNGCRKECAAGLASLPVPFRYEFLMAETILSQLLFLPQPPFKPIYYTLVIMDLCKALPGAFPAVVAGAVRTLFEKIADLDMECRTRLINWFSHHLSNFQFIWPWEEWAYVLDLPQWAPQRVFVQEVLEREVRLSYWDKIKQSVENSPGLEELLPPKATPNFKYGAEASNGNNELQTLSSELCKKVKAKETAREIISWIEESVITVHPWEITLEVVAQTLLDIGSKSFTHLITVLERYNQVISRLCPDHDKQVMLINEVASYWANNTQMAAIAIDRMMGYRLISNVAIVTWVFSPSNINLFHVTNRPWEILRNAISKTYNRISDLRNEISCLKTSLPSIEEAATKSKSELNEAESKLSLIDGEPVLGENPAKMKRLKSRAEQSSQELSSHLESLEAKEALLLRAMEENEALYVSLYGNFSRVVTERLSDSSIKTLDDLKRVHIKDVAMVDDDDSSKMEVDGEKENHQTSNGNGVYNLGENEQWCLTTLGYVKAITYQFASEVWRCVGRLDAEVFTDTHPIFMHFVNLGLRRSAPA